jgi:hypothetical protein
MWTWPGLESIGPKCFEFVLWFKPHSQWDFRLLIFDYLQIESHSFRFICSNIWHFLCTWPNKGVRVYSFDWSFSEKTVGTSSFLLFFLIEFCSILKLNIDMNLDRDLVWTDLQVSITNLTQLFGNCDDNIRSIHLQMTFTF